MIAQRITRTHWLIGAAVAFCLYIAFGLYQAGLDEVAPPSNAPTTINGGTANGHRLTTKSWTLEYDSVRSSNDNTYIEALGVHNAVIYKHGQPYLHLRADRATINLATRDVVVQGRIHIESKIGDSMRTFETESATWTDGTELLLMPGVIRLSSNGATLTVAGATVDVHSGRTRLGRIDGGVRP